MGYTLWSCCRVLMARRIPRVREGLLGAASVSGVSVEAGRRSWRCELKIFADLGSDPKDVGTEALDGVHGVYGVHVQSVVVGFEIHGPDYPVRQFFAEFWSQLFSSHGLSIEVILFADCQVDAQSVLPRAIF